MSDLKSLTEELNPVVWVLCAFDNAGLMAMVTSFCVHKKGYIMTCAQGLGENEHSGLQCKAPRIDENGLNHTAKIVAQRQKWDITVLKLEVLSSGLIYESETVILIGNSNFLIGSVFVGHSAYRCVLNPTVPTRNLNCLKYVSTESCTP